MKRLVLLLSLLWVWGCARQELIEEVDDPGPVYERVRAELDRRIASIDELHCLGQLNFVGSRSLYVTLDYGPEGGTLEVFSLLRRKVGWVRFDPDSTTHSFEDSPELADLGEYGVVLGWGLIGHPLLPSEVQILKVGESTHSYYLAVRNRDLVYHLKVFKEPIVVESMKVRRGESVLEMHFSNHWKIGQHLFPHLITGSTPFGDFQLRYLEISERR